MTIDSSFMTKAGFSDQRGLIVVAMLSSQDIKQIWELHEWTQEMSADKMLERLQGQGVVQPLDTLTGEGSFVYNEIKKLFRVFKSPLTGPAAAASTSVSQEVLDAQQIARRIKTVGHASQPREGSGLDMYDEPIVQESAKSRQVDWPKIIR